MRGEIIGNGQSHVVAFERFVIALHFTQNQPVVVPGVDVVWFLVKRPSVALDALIEFIEQVFAVGQFIPCLGKISIKLKGPLKVGFCSAKRSSRWRMMPL